MYQCPICRRRGIRLFGGLQLFGETSCTACGETVGYSRWGAIAATVPAIAVFFAALRYDRPEVLYLACFVALAVVAAWLLFPPLTPRKRAGNLLKLARALAWLVSVVFLVESVDMALMSRHGLLELEKTQALRSAFSKGLIDTTCPKDRYKTRYECFRAVEAPLLSRPVDAARAASLMQLAVKVLSQDERQNRSTLDEANVELAEFSLDLSEQVLKAPVPGRFSPLYSGQAERQARGLLFTYLTKSLEAGFDGAESDRAFSKGGPLSRRLRLAERRYQALYPKLQEQARLRGLAYMPEKT